jgi:hypothetical protein
MTQHLKEQQQTPISQESSNTHDSSEESMRAKLAKMESDLTSKFDGLTRRERMLVQREQEMKQRLSQLGSMDELRELASKDPSKALERLGLSYDKLTDHYANMDPANEDKRITQSLKEEIDGLKSKLTEQEKTSQQRELDRIRMAKIDNIKSLASKEGSEYGLISHFGVYDDVLNFMAEHYNETGDILSESDAMAKVEDRLAENLKALRDNPKVRMIFGLQEQANKGPEHVGQNNGMQNESTPGGAPFGLHDSNLRNNSPKEESLEGLSEQQLFELALQKMP